MATLIVPITTVAGIARVFMATAIGLIGTGTGNGAGAGGDYKVTI